MCEFDVDNDPILVLNYKLIETIGDSDCMDAVGALALLLTSTLEVLKRNCPHYPATVLDIQDSLNDLVVGILQSHTPQRTRES